MAAIPTCGYELVGYLKLPENVWWTEYFNPLRKRLLALRYKHKGDCETLAVLAREEQEVDFFKKYPNWYRSAFFVMQKASDASV
jgi:hypothetical protein